MTPEVMQFGEKIILPIEVTNKRIVEVGSYNVNGSFSTFVKKYKPKEYLGLDLTPCDHDGWVCNDGSAVHLEEPCVNLVMDVLELVDRFGKESFDYVICTEMLEHAENWKACISVMKNALKSNGYLVLTTRSPGFPVHSYPDDWWRFTVEDMQYIFADCEILALESEKTAEGVDIKVKKPVNFKERIIDIDVFSMKTLRHVPRDI
jgi:SAM-dependent methyltransferase